MPPQTPSRQTTPQQTLDAGHEPPAFESDLDRHRASVDEVYGSHGVQPEPGETAFQPGAGRASRGLSRVGVRRRR
ncbi:hypothetical protein FNB15_20850 [Ferrovibrio terrae]|uniref:Uncharacterized protein n=1 Tax=Ferrovibrio terrae TaxID=2594003 RepID=A0A516H761_9PROT|nr:hypothetical protein [Ferrovibrio terrae]QDO99560.1 hypothetical protein FNB15_20850 [Ferrovibrio terrae]